MNTNLNMERVLFSILSNFPLKNNEFKNNNIHIIRSILDNEISYRVYAQNKFCFDSSQVENWDFTQGEISFEYDYFNQWDGYDRITIKQAIRVIRKHLD